MGKRKISLIKLWLSSYYKCFTYWLLIILATGTWSFRTDIIRGKSRRSHQHGANPVFVDFKTEYNCDILPVPVFFLRKAETKLLDLLLYRCLLWLSFIWTEYFYSHSSSRKLVLFFLNQLINPSNSYKGYLRRAPWPVL